MNAASSYPRQLALDLAHRPALGAEDFFLSQSNDMAVKFIDDWPQWAQYGQLLIGPQDCGKSHLINVWRLRADANILKAKELCNSSLQSISPSRPVCIEDLDQGVVNEDALFHLLNMINEQGNHVLISTRVGVGELDFKLKDLQSRLLALPSVSINPPDDNLLKAVMIKQFSDRQMDIEPQLIEYLFKRMERSMRAVSKMVDDLDRGSLGTGRRITKPLARKILSDRS